MGQIDVTEQVVEAISGLSYREFIELDVLAHECGLDIEQYVYVRLINSLNAACGTANHAKKLTPVCHKRA